MAHPARGPAVPRTAVSLHKHSTGHGRPSTPGSGLPAHAPQRRRGPQRACPATPTPLSARRGCLPWRHAAAGGSGSRTNGQQGTPVCAAARGPVCAAADTAPRLDSPRRLLGCQATFRPPVGAATRSNRRCALPYRSAPPGGAQGRHRRRCALPVPLLPLTPHPPQGALRIAALLEVAWLRHSCRRSVAALPRRPGLPPKAGRRPRARDTGSLGLHLSLCGCCSLLQRLAM